MGNGAWPFCNITEWLGQKKFVNKLINDLLNANTLLSLQLTHMSFSTIVSTIIPPIYRIFLFFLYANNSDLFRTQFSEGKATLMIGSLNVQIIN